MGKQMFPRIELKVTSKAFSKFPLAYCECEVDKGPDKEE